METLKMGKQVILFEVAGGAPLWSVARDLCRWTKEHSAEAIVIFNGRALTADASTTEREVLMQFDAGMTQLFAAK